MEVPNPHASQTFANPRSISALAVLGKEDFYGFWKALALPGFSPILRVSLASTPFPEPRSWPLRGLLLQFWWLHSNSKPCRSSPKHHCPSLLMILTACQSDLFNCSSRERAKTCLWNDWLELIWLGVVLSSVEFSVRTNICVLEPLVHPVGVFKLRGLVRTSSCRCRTPRER